MLLRPASDRAFARAARRPAKLALLATLFLLLPAVAACASDTSATTSGADCQHWCGQAASATVTFQGSTVAIKGGGCYDDGANGVDIRIGDWQGDGTQDYVMLIGYRPGGPTAPPGALATDQAGNALFAPPISGSVGGEPFLVQMNASVTLSSATSGSFSGEDVNGLGPVSGSFVCQ